MESKRILVIEDDSLVSQLVEATLVEEGADVLTAENGQEGLRRFYTYRPHLVIIDLLMPEMDGWETTRRLRQFSNVPIIILTALDGDDQIIRGLDIGAVDYITKPFSTTVLAARVRAALRRTGDTAPLVQVSSYHDQYLSVDIEGQRVYVRGQPVRLTRTEYNMLAYLVRNAGRVLTFQQILQHVWGWDYQENVEYVHVYASRLRRKLEKDPKNPEYIVTEYGLGYRFERKSS